VTCSSTHRRHTEHSCDLQQHTKGTIRAQQGPAAAHTGPAQWLGQHNNTHGSGHCYTMTSTWQHTTLHSIPTFTGHTITYFTFFTVCLCCFPCVCAYYRWWWSRKVRRERRGSSRGYSWRWHSTRKQKKETQEYKTIRMRTMRGSIYPWAKSPSSRPDSTQPSMSFVLFRNWLISKT
jgi:hypothetical protein